MYVNRHIQLKIKLEVRKSTAHLKGEVSRETETLPAC